MEPDQDPSWREEVSFYVRVHHRLRSGLRRLRGGWWQIFQTAVAAGVAWFLAFLILGREQPDFAPIAAVLSLGLAVGQRGRRAVEVVLGVALGVAIADLLVLVVGVGAVQIGLVVALAMTVAVFFGRGELGVNEAAVSAMILILAFAPSGSGFAPDRFLEALIGGGTALLVNALLPINPERMVREAAHPVFDDSVAVLEEVAAALDDGDLERAQRAFIKSRELDARVSGFKEALEAGRETARIAPPRRGALGHLELYAAAADQIDLTVRDVRGLSRAALSVVEPDSPAPEPLSAALRDLGQATEALAGYLDAPEDPEDTRRLALRAAQGATALLEEHQDLATNLAINALVDQVHSAAVDILGGTGMDREAALQALREAARRTSEPG
jgi:Fusaric acid resistance protein-like